MMDVSQEIMIHSFDLSCEEEIPFSTVTLDQICSQIVKESLHRYNLSIV